MWPADLDISKVSFSNIRASGKGKAVYVNYDGRNSVVLQTPDLDIPFDTGSYYESGPDGGKWAIKVSLRGHDSDDKMKNLHDKLVELDELILAAAKKNSFAWFKKKNMSDEMIENLYTPQVKVSVDKETGEPNGRFPPNFTFKISKYDGKVQCDCYDGNEKPVKKMNVENEDEDDFVMLGASYDPDNHEGLFKGGTKVKVIMKCFGLWFSASGFGVKWNATQMRVKAQQKFDNYSFLDDSDDDGEEVTAP